MRLRPALVPAAALAGLFFGQRLGATPAATPWEGTLFRLMAEAAVEYAIYLLDERGHVQTWNPGGERIKGYKADEILGRHYSVFYPEDEAAAGKPEHLLETAREEGQARDEGWRVRKDGSRFWADVLMVSLRDANGAHRGFAKLTRDMSDRRLYEERLEAQNQLLAQRVDDQSAELRELAAIANSAREQERAASPASSTTRSPRRLPRSTWTCAGSSRTRSRMPVCSRRR